MNRPRTALLTWSVVYPIITGVLALLEPLMSGVAMPVRTLVLTTIMTPTMVYVAMPFANRLLDVLAEVRQSLLYGEVRRVLGTPSVEEPQVAAR